MAKQKNLETKYGTDMTSFILQGTKIFIKNDKCVDKNGTLAGSNLTMIDAVRNAHRDIGLPLETCLKMASLPPARFLGLDHKIGRIAVGYEADMVMIDPTTLTLKATWLAGVNANELNPQPS